MPHMTTGWAQWQHWMRSQDPNNIDFLGGDVRCVCDTFLLIEGSQVSKTEHKHEKWQREWKSNLKYNNACRPHQWIFSASIVQICTGPVDISTLVLKWKKRIAYYMRNVLERKDIYNMFLYCSFVNFFFFLPLLQFNIANVILLSWSYPCGGGGGELV